MKDSKTHYEGSRTEAMEEMYNLVQKDLLKKFKIEKINNEFKTRIQEVTDKINYHTSDMTHSVRPSKEDDDDEEVEKHIKLNK
jgi:predicted transglutaminase-like cysteine proteinase